MPFLAVFTRDRTLTGTLEGALPGHALVRSPSWPGLLRVVRERPVTVALVDLADLEGVEEPGRTGESVSRQLEYSSGAAFRRALREYTGATPTHVAERGGLEFVLG